MSKLAHNTYNTYSVDSGTQPTEALDFFCAAARADSEHQLRQTFQLTLQCLGIDYFQFLRVNQTERIVWSEPASKVPPPLYLLDTESALGASRDCVGQLQIWADGYLTDVIERLGPTPDQWLAVSYANGMRSGATITLKHPDRSRDIFRFGANTATFLTTYAGDIGLSATIAAFAARQLRSIDDQKLRNDNTCPTLSSRELEVLRWSKDGKSYPDDPPPQRVPELM